MKMSKRNVTSSIQGATGLVHTVLQLVVSWVCVVHLGWTQHPYLQPTLHTLNTTLHLPPSHMRRNPSSPSHYSRLRLTLSQRRSDLVSHLPDAGRLDSNHHHWSPQPPTWVVSLLCHRLSRFMMSTRRQPTSKMRIVKLLRSRIGREYPSPSVTSFIIWLI